MRAIRFLKPRPLVIALTFLMALCVDTAPCNAQQQQPNSPASSDRVDRDVYRTLFRQAIAYQKLADEAEASPAPKPFLRHLMALRFELSNDDAESLNRLSVAYQAEIDPIQKQVVEVIKRFHARFPSGVIQPGMDASPPTDLTALERQEDTVTLRYRDLLRNSMREDTFQKFHASLLETFGKSK
jgi:hypothetical protein